VKGAEHAARCVITDVVTEHVRVCGTAGVALAGPDGPERALLRRWFEDAPFIVAEPDPERVAELYAALVRVEPDGGTDGEGVDPRHALEVAAAVLADRQHLTMVTCETRTLLVLDGVRSNVVPLGDVPASAVQTWTGDATLPALLRTHPASLLEALDGALSAFLEHGRPLSTALAELPADLAQEVAATLRGRGVPAARPPLVPKLSRWTPGHDLAP
jgi:hypothetical protein